MGLVRRLEFRAARDVVSGTILRSGKSDCGAYQDAFNKRVSCPRAEIEEVQLRKQQALVRDAEGSCYYLEKIASSGLDADCFEYIVRHDMAFHIRGGVCLRRGCLTQ